MPPNIDSMILTEREKQIVDLIVKEHSTREIAQKLYLSTETIKTYRKNIRLKLGVKNVAGIVREAISLNVIPLYLPQAISPEALALQQ